MTVTMNQQPKTRSPRSDRGTVRQTARDVHLLTWLSEMYGAPLDLIERLAGVSRPRAYGLVSRWKKAGWVKSGQVDAGPAWVWPTQSTASAYLERQVTNWRPALARVAHLRATAALRLHRVGADLDRWEGERQLTARYFLKKADKPGHRPDGVEITGDGRRVAIEVELTAKNAERYWDPVTESGLLNEVANAARNAGAQDVAYWCTRAVRPVLERAIAQYQRKWGGREVSIRWWLLDIEEVPGWTWSTEAG